MSEHQQEPDSSPYSRPPARKKEEKAAIPAAALIAGAAVIASVLAFAVLRSQGRAPEAVAVSPAEAAAPAPAPRPASVADPRTGLKRCRPYADYVANQKNPAISEAQLIEEAACLCSLAGGYMVGMDTPGTIQQYRKYSACPSRSTPVPLEPAAKVWFGQWIDEPGHWACACSTTPREIKMISLPRTP